MLLESSSDDDNRDDDVPLMVRQIIARVAQKRNFDNASSPPADDFYENIAREHKVDAKIVREIFINTPRAGDEVDASDVSAAAKAEQNKEVRDGIEKEERQKRQSAIEATAFIQNNLNNIEQGIVSESEDEEHVVRVASVEDDDDEQLASTSKNDDAQKDNVRNGKWQGIHEEIKIPVACGDKIGTLILPKKYKTKQERVLYDSQTMTPSQFEAFGGRGNAKKWKTSISVISPNGNRSQNVGNFIKQNKLFPLGHAMEHATKKVAKSANFSIVSDRTYAPSTTSAKKKEYSDVFSESLAETLNSHGGIRSREALLEYTELMKSCTDAVSVQNADQKRIVMLAALLRTDIGVREKKILETVVGNDSGGEALDVSASWLADSASRHSSGVLVSILRALKMLPITTSALTRTQLGVSVRKLKKYVYVAKEGDSNPEESKEQANKVPKLAQQLYERWKQIAISEQNRAEENKKRKK